MGVKHYFFVLLLLTTQLTAVTISPEEQRQFDKFVKDLPNQYLAYYNEPLSHGVLNEVAHIQLEPRTIEVYNRDFGTEINLKDSVGITRIGIRRHTHPALQKYKESVTKSTRPLSFNQLMEIETLNVYAGNLPSLMKHDSAPAITQENISALVKTDNRHQSLTKESLTKEKTSKHKEKISIPFNKLLEIYSHELPAWTARAVYQKNESALVAIERQYGVPRSIMLAVLGCETGWGDNIGNFDILNSLATLAFKASPARQTMYQKNLLSFMHLLTEIHALGTDKIYLSTFDGGMGIAQFEPYNYQQYAMSHDGKATADIWTSIPDAAASVAYFLHKHGWQANVSWGYFIKLPAHNQVIKKLAYKQDPHPLSFWLKQGITFPLLDEKQVTTLNKTINAQLFIPRYHHQADYAFLLTSNFDVLMKWNPSSIEGMMISILSEVMANPNIDYETFKNH